jgi:hypothetical protein
MTPDDVSFVVRDAKKEINTVATLSLASRWF